MSNKRVRIIAGMRQLWLLIGISLAGCDGGPGAEKKTSLAADGGIISRYREYPESQFFPD